MENGWRDTRIDEAIALLYKDTAITIKLELVKTMLEQKFTSDVFFVLWSNPDSIAVKEDPNNAFFKFWFTNKEDYAMALLIG